MIKKWKWSPLTETSSDRVDGSLWQHVKAWEGTSSRLAEVFANGRVVQHKS